MFTGWMHYADTEIVNEARLAAYATALSIPGFQCEECPTLRTSLEQDPYTNPTDDHAPWYDPSIAESAQVAGFQILSINGLGDTGSRRVDQLARDGAVVGPRRRASREITINLVAVAATECAASYAVSWLSRVLRGQQCSPINSQSAIVPTTCSTSALCLLTCCPTVPADMAKYQVSLFKVGVTEGPTVVKHQSTLTSGDACGLVICEVEIVFTAGDPGWYSQPITLVDNVDIVDFYVSTSLIFDITVTRDSLGCGNNLGCLDEFELVVPPGCATTDPVIPSVLPQPRTGDSSPYSNFYSIPVDMTGISTWMDLVPMIYYTGSPEGPGDVPSEGPIDIQLRRPTVDEPCGEIANPCNSCIEAYSPVFERGERNVLDWVNRKGFRLNSSNTNLCPFPIYTRELAPFRWPTITCGPEMCLDVFSNADNDGRAGKIQLDVMRRQDALC